jgi:hypothetical protein
VILTIRKAVFGAAVLSMSFTGMALSAPSGGPSNPPHIPPVVHWTPEPSAKPTVLPTPAPPKPQPAPVAPKVVTPPPAPAPAPPPAPAIDPGALPTKTHSWNGEGYPRDIYKFLREAGLNRTQAVAVLGNVENESSYNPETNAMDSNGLRSYGLICWNAGSYPDAYKLVTGHPTQDIKAQIRFLLTHTNNVWRVLHSNLNAHDMAGDFNQFVEVSAYSWPGGIQHEQRSANADHINQMVRR